MLEEDGYGYVIPAADNAFNARLREAILEQSEKSGGTGANMLLDKDPVFAEVITNPKLLASGGDVWQRVHDLPNRRQRTSRRCAFHRAPRGPELDPCTLPGPQPAGDVLLGYR